MVTFLTGAGVVLVAGALLAAFRWARPPVSTRLLDDHGRTREQTRAIELVTGLTVNQNCLFP